MNVTPQAAAAPDHSTAALSHYFQQHIQPMCAEFERLRLQAKGQTGKRMWIALPLAVVAFYVTVLLVSKVRFDLGLAVGGLLALGLWVYVALPGHAFQQDIKGRVWPVVFKFYGPDFDFRRADGSSHNAYMLRNTGVMPDAGRWLFGDRVTGTYRGVRISVEELTVKSEAKEKKDEKQLFKGLVISLHLPLPLRGRTLVLRESGMAGNLSRRLGHELARVRLEDPQFERAFEVFGQDQIDARVALTPAMMERLTFLEQQHGGKLQCCFHPAGFHAFIATPRDYFEVQSGLDNTITFRKDVMTLRSEMQTVFSVVDQLKLHQPGRI